MPFPLCHSGSVRNTAWRHDPPTQARCEPGSMPTDGSLDLNALVTQSYPMDDIGQAVDHLESGRIAGSSILVFD